MSIACFLGHVVSLLLFLSAVATVNFSNVKHIYGILIQIRALFVKYYTRPS